MIVPPGSTIGIVGGGQLGRMIAMAAAQLGYKCHIYAPDEAPPAAEVSARFTRGGDRKSSIKTLVISGPQPNDHPSFKIRRTKGSSAPPIPPPVSSAPFGPAR